MEEKNTKNITFISVFILLPLIFSTIIFSKIISPGHAVDDNRGKAYAFASIVDTQDGTGHGTESQTFINSSNGYQVGDNTPQDRIVSSGDYVTAKVRLAFTAAKQRTVRVGAHLSDAPYLKLTRQGGFCEKGNIVQARFNSDGSCSYTIPTGAVETLTFAMIFQAQDTAGKIEKDQNISLSISREGLQNSTELYPIRPFTVVSSPMADIVFDNGGYSGRDKSSDERITTIYDNRDESQPVTGFLDILSEKSVIPSHNTSHGLSSSGLYDAFINVLSLPQGTEYTVTSQGNTSSVTPNNGIIKVSGVSGDIRLNYSIPGSSFSSMSTGSSQSYDVSVDVNREAFTSGDNTQLNNGVGFDPGSRLDKNTSKKEEKINPVSSYPYTNNNWTRIIINKTHVPNGSIFGKSLYKPSISVGKTIFDAEAQTLSSGKQWVYNANRRVSQGTEVETRLFAEVKNMTDGIQQNSYVTFEDTWDNSEQTYVGRIDVTQGDTVLYPYKDFDIEYRNKSGQWVARTPSDNSTMVSGLRMKVKNTSIITGSQAPRLYASFVAKATGDPSQGNIIAEDTGTFSYTNSSGISKKGSVDNNVIIVAQPQPSASQSLKQSIQAKDGSSVDSVAVSPGNIVHYTINPRALNIVSSSDVIVPRIEVIVPHLLSIKNINNTSWNMSEEDVSGGKKLVFTYNSPSGAVDTRSITPEGTLTIPEISISGIVPNTASGVQSVSSNYTYVYNNTTTVVSSAQNNSYILLTTDSEASSLVANNSSVDVGDPFSYTFNIYARGSSRTGTSSTVIRLSNNSDSTMTGDNNTGLDGSWNEYDLGSSSYHGSYELKEPVSLHADNSTSGTTVYYSTTNVYTDNPQSYTWKTWDDLTQEDKKNITALKVESSFTKNSEESVAITSAVGTLTIHPSNNVKDDQYLVWIGRAHFSDGHEKGALPFPDKTVVKAGSITGTLFWDMNNNSFKDDSEDTIPHINISLYNTDDLGHATGSPIATTQTDNKGFYSFENLHSGTYVTVVQRAEGTTTNNGVQTSTTTYFNQEKPVVNTLSYGDFGSKATDTSSVINLSVGQNIQYVDFGFYKPDPKATLNKALTDMSCDAQECVVKWDVTVENTAKNIGEKVFQPSHYTIAATPDGKVAYIDNDGKLFVIDQYNGVGETSVPVLPDKRFVHVDAVSTELNVRIPSIDQNTSFLAIDDNGGLWIWGNDFREETKNQPIPVSDPVHLNPDQKYSKALFFNGRYYTTENIIRLSTLKQENNHSDIELSYGNLANNERTVISNTFKSSFGRFESTNLYGTPPLLSIHNLYDGGVELDKDEQVSQKIGTYTLMKNGDVIYHRGQGDEKIVGSNFSQLFYYKNNYYALRKDGGISALNSTSSQETSIADIQTVKQPSVTVIEDAPSVSANLLPSGSILTDRMSDTVKDVSVTAGVQNMPEGVKIKKFNLINNDSSFAITTTGDLYTWGNNIFEHLGVGDSLARNTPTKVMSNVHDIYFDPTVAPVIFATTNNNELYAWGDDYNSLGITGNPTKIMDDIKNVISSNYSFFAIKNNGDLYAWGSNVYGQLCVGDSLIRSTPTKVMINNVKNIYTNPTNKFTFILTTNNDLYSCGNNPHGELGTGDNIQKNSPTKIMSNIKNVYPRSNSIFATTYTNELYAWGVGSFDALGTGDSNDKSTPTKIMDNVKNVIIDTRDVTFAITNNNELYAWGYNTKTTPKRAPSPTKIMDNVKNFTSNPNGLYAITTSNDLYVWGNNNYNELGIPEYSTIRTPTKILSNIDNVATKFNSVFAITTNKELYAWGNNNYGKRGTGGTNVGSIPTKILNNIEKVIPGTDSTFAITHNGVLYSWGRNNSGQLGVGDTQNRHIPTRVAFPEPSDPTAVSVEPTSITTSNNLTTRTYATPFDVSPGGKIVFHFTGRVPRTQADQIISNQSWFTSPDTPYAGTPHARNARVSEPQAANINNFNETSLDITGNNTCMTGSDYFLPEMEHYLTINNEDLCDQVGVRVPAYVTEPVWGSISGLVWKDTNSDGNRQSTETERYKNYKVFLLNNNGEVVSTTTTNDNGEYTFDTLKLGTYTVLFSKPENSGFTRYNAPTASTTTNSDALTETSSYGSSVSLTLNTTTRNITNIDAGIKPDYITSIQLEKGLLDKDSIHHNVIRHRNEEIPVTFRITNTGTEKLMDISMTDTTTIGRDDVHNITCNYRTETINGIKRNVLNPNEQVSCQGILIVRDLSNFDEPAHENVATVTAVGVETLKNVSDTDTFSVTTNLNTVHDDPPFIVYDLPQTGSTITLIIIIGSLVLLAIGGIVLIRKNDDK